MILLKITTSVVAQDLRIAQRVRQRFQLEAGKLILDAIRNHLGSSGIYTLSPEYAKSKQERKGFRRVGGKAGDQPLILTAEMYNSLTVVPTGDGFTVEVEEGRAESPKGFDYAEWWEEITSYMELGFFDVDAQLDELLADIIVDEMLL